MSSVTTKDAVRTFSEVVNRVAFGRERIALTRRGRKLAAIVPLEDLEALERRAAGPADEEMKRTA